VVEIKPTLCDKTVVQRIYFLADALFFSSSSSSLLNVVKRRDIIPFHSQGGTTYHSVHRATSLLNMTTADTLRGHLSNSRALRLKLLAAEKEID